MISIIKKRLAWDNNLVSGQGGAADSSGERKCGLAQIPDLWQGIGVSSQSSNRYALPGIRPRFSFETVEAKSLRQSRLHAEPEIDLSQTIADIAANKSDEVILKPTDSHTPKAEPLSTDEIIKEALLDYFYFEDSDGEQGEKRQQVMQTVFDLMLEYSSEFTFLPVNPDHTKPYRKIPQKAHIEEIFSLVKIGTDFDFSEIKIRKNEYYQSLKHLDMFNKKAVFWGVVEARVEKTIDRNSSLKESAGKNLLGFFSKLFRSHRVDSRGDDGAAASEMQSNELRPDERVVNEYPKGIGVMTYARHAKDGKRLEDIVQIGSFDEWGSLSGIGIARVPGLGVFHGDFRNGYPHGYGSLYYDNGDIYTGNYDHGVGSGKAVFTTNEGRQTVSENTLHGIFWQSTTTELDSNSVHRTGPDTGEQQKQKKIEHTLDGTIMLEDVPHVLGSFGYGNFLHYQRVDGGYVTYKEDYWDKGSYQLHCLRSPAGWSEERFMDPARISPRTIQFGERTSEDIKRGGDLPGKKKK